MQQQKSNWGKGLPAARACDARVGILSQIGSVKGWSTPLGGFVLEKKCPAAAIPMWGCTDDRGWTPVLTRLNAKGLCGKAGKISRHNNGCLPNWFLSYLLCFFVQMLICSTDIKIANADVQNQHQNKLIRFNNKWERRSGRVQTLMQFFPTWALPAFRACKSLM